MSYILFVTPYYPPEKTPPAIRISEMAQQLVTRGHRVTILTTFPNFPSGVVPLEYRGRFIQHEARNGVRIVRAWSYITPNKGFFRRILGQLSFGCIAPLLGWKDVGRPDLIIAESPPLFDAIAARLLAWGKRCPYIFTIADLWPESAVQLGMLRNRVAIRLAEWLEWSTYQRAWRVWAVTQGIRDILIERGLAPERVFLLTNGVDINKFRPLSRAQARAELGWDNRFTVLYAGTHGVAQGLNTVLEAARRMQDNADVRFVFAGDGAEKAYLMTQASIWHLENVSFLEPQSHERMPLLLAAADVCLVPLRRIPLFEGALPSKIYEIMACARPILLGVDGEARRLAEQEAGAAMYVEPENPAALVSAILSLRQNPEIAGILGRRGRAFVASRYDRAKLCETLEAQIEALPGRKQAAIEAAEPVSAGTGTRRG
ncbi:MAG TPA: glycosyltransferase family 4 protein [Ktedonobacteraceae bacterium]|nr:glycosyltransferase family 4 protein [Ktedonobacteraceae bacterium]